MEVEVVILMVEAADILITIASLSVAQHDMAVFTSLVKQPSVLIINPAESEWECWV